MSRRQDYCRVTAAYGLRSHADPVCHRHVARPPAVRRGRRRRLLEELELTAGAWHTPCAFDDGEALYEVVCAQGLDGVVAKRRSSLYRSDGRGWVKMKNPAYWRREEEQEAWGRVRSRAPSDDLLVV
jgi:hypothetical protein